ncbi:MAG TPA: hypothetical protein PKD86_06045 [Gemmatales bacterium]|nr:hypothetical protein [Gemmatales bacterium]HMP58896.1 hypothetical protein [Gemmatales bacterium]
MSPLRSVPGLFLAALVPLLGDALGPTVRAASACPPLMAANLGFVALAPGQGQETPPTAESTQAAELLQKSIAALKAMTSYEAVFLQETRTDELATVAEGVFVVGPERRVRYELRVHRGAIKGSMLIVSDGTRLWRQVKAGPQTNFESYPLAQFDEEISQLTIDKQTALEEKQLEQLRRDLMAEHGFVGITATLDDLVKMVAWKSARQQTRPEGGAIWVLEGEWSQALRDQVLPKKKGTDPNEPDYPLLWDVGQIGLFLPRQCRLTLDAQSLVPVSVEWLGPRQMQGPLVVLARLTWTIKTLPAEEAQRRCQLTEAEQAEPIREGSFTNLIRQRLDFMVRQKQRDDELRRRQLQQQEQRPPPGP